MGPERYIHGWEDHPYKFCPECSSNLSPLLFQDTSKDSSKIDILTKEFSVGWIALTISIWQHRNLLIFQGKSFDSSKVMDDALFLAWSWLKAREKDFNISFNHWSSNISGQGT